ncbi:hypothetical protein [Streptomyces mangrovisoli]|uniref:Uncharacterized protein n=1 Tax=Streptomyces mangrovisoli TaxID=1428628 RepID=A0A1J4P1C5_9ACTN|nr:hypothetical protein [Streptomyces mangrovisoli]OIJ68403.1 hypothetical protein WN71_008265 [Streptomyces mangrovisoli]
MADGPTGNDGDGKWLIGAIGTALAVAAFLGIHNVSQLEDWAKGSSHTAGTPQPTSAFSTTPLFSPAPATTATCSSDPYCGTTHFNAEGTPQFDGDCRTSSDGGCPVSRVFTNNGTETGGATATFTLYKDSNHTDVAATCTAIIPSTPQGGSVTARCTIQTSYDGKVWLRAIPNNPTD